MTKHVALVGAAMSDLDKYNKVPAMQMARDTIEAAIVDSGVDRKMIEGLTTTPPSLAYHQTCMFVARLSEHLGMPLKSLVGVENGGCSAMLALRAAIHEVQSGRVRVAVALGIDQRLPEMPAPGETIDAFLDRNVFPSASVYGAYDCAYGLAAPIPVYAMSAQRYMHETGATAEDLAWVSVRLREHANKNPKAMFFDKKLTVEEVLSSGYLSPPLHLADCSQFVAGAGAAVVMDADLAKSLGKPYAILRGWGQAHHPSTFATSAESITTFPAVRRAAAEAFEQAKISAKDIDVAEIYGVFSSTELMLSEDIGFFPRGEAAAAFKAGRTTFGGDVVIDPSGGRLSLGHPACATPLLSTFEILMQLRGSAGERQVKNAKLGLVHAEHGMLNGSAIAIWERNEP
ncbi:MAG: thiolase family protein [Kofleriaceae bacterium]